MGTLRVASWNVRDLLGDPFALRRVLRSLRADVVCLQEAPRRPGGGWRTGRVARDCGLRHAGGGRASGGPAMVCAMLSPGGRSHPRPCAGRYAPWAAAPRAPPGHPLGRARSSCPKGSRQREALTARTPAGPAGEPGSRPRA